MTEWSHFPEAVKTGGLTGQGFVNLLGRPRLSPMSLLLREAAQNAWDARKRESGNARHSVRFLVARRTLTTSQAALFRRMFRPLDGLEPRGDNTLSAMLREDGPIPVLEIADSGTVGLSGPVRADEPVGSGDSRFIDFFFDVGKGHPDSGDGGTYGFGRSSLYLMSRAHTILVDTLVRHQGALERRLMGSRIGPSFEIGTGQSRGRYSGRHFWGVATGETVVPLRDHEADEATADLGLPTREGERTGTTILIPWPLAEGLPSSEIADMLLEHLWPKMVPTDSGTSPMEFRLFEDNREVEVPSPVHHPHYRLLVQSLIRARTRNEHKGAVPVETLRPRILTGHLALTRAAVGAPRVGVQSTPIGESVDPDALAEVDEEEVTPNSGSRVVNRIALMRPTELVVGYLPVRGTENLEQDWGGVFICAEAPEVVTAFAKSEPPAHDDWVPDRLTTKRERYLVGKTVKDLLPEIVREQLGVSLPQVGESTTATSLGGASARFAEALLAGPGSMPSHGDAAPPASTGKRRAGVAASVSTPRLTRLEMRGKVKCAVFSVQVRGAAGTEVVLRAVPEVYTDSRMDELPEGVVNPRVIEWSGARGVSGAQATVVLDGEPTEVEVTVAILGEYAVHLTCDVASGATP